MSVKSDRTVFTQGHRAALHHLLGRPPSRQGPRDTSLHSAGAGSTAHRLSTSVRIICEGGSTCPYFMARFEPLGIISTASSPSTRREVVVKVAGIVERIADYNHRTAGGILPAGSHSFRHHHRGRGPASPPRRHTYRGVVKRAVESLPPRGVRMRAHSCSRSIYFLSLVGFTGASISL